MVPETESLVLSSTNNVDYKAYIKLYNHRALFGEIALLKRCQLAICVIARGCFVSVRYHNVLPDSHVVS